MTELGSLRMQLTDMWRHIHAQHEERTQLAAEHETAHQLADANQHKADTAWAAVVSLQEQLDAARQQLQAQHPSSLQASQPSSHCPQTYASNLA